MSKPEEEFMDQCQLLKFLYEELCNKDIKKIRGRYCKAFGIIRLRMMSNVRLLLQRYEHQNFVSKYKFLPPLSIKVYCGISISRLYLRCRQMKDTGLVKWSFSKCFLLRHQKLIGWCIICYPVKCYDFHVSPRVYAVPLILVPRLIQFLLSVEFETGRSPYFPLPILPSLL
jgi:hypothetical protein